MIYGISSGAPVGDFVGVALIDAFVTSKSLPIPRPFDAGLEQGDREAMGARCLLLRLQAARTGSQ